MAPNSDVNNGHHGDISYFLLLTLTTENAVEPLGRAPLMSQNTTIFVPAISKEDNPHHKGFYIV